MTTDYAVRSLADENHLINLIAEVIVEYANTHTMVRHAMYAGVDGTGNCYGDAPSEIETTEFEVSVSGAASDVWPRLYVSAIVDGCHLGFTATFDRRERTRNYYRVAVEGV